MNRRQLLAGLIPLSMAAALPAGAIIGTKPKPNWMPGGISVLPQHWGSPCTFHGYESITETADRYKRLDAKADVCKTCDVRHVPMQDKDGRPCYREDLVSKIEQLQGRNDDLHERDRSRSDVLGKMLKLGFGLQLCADHIGVSRSTIKKWIADDPKFLSWGETR